MDSFQKLLEEEHNDLVMPEQTLKDIEKRVHFSTQPVRFVANTVDLFLPKAINALMAVIGASSFNKRVRKTPTPSHQTDPANGGL
jgi:hypothetical protein